MKKLKVGIREIAFGNWVLPTSEHKLCAPPLAVGGDTR